MWSDHSLRRFRDDGAAGRVSDRGERARNAHAQIFQARVGAEDAERAGLDQDVAERRRLDGAGEHGDAAVYPGDGAPGGGTMRSPQRPCQTGARRSAKARTPSLKSSLP